MEVCLINFDKGENDEGCLEFCNILKWSATCLKDEVQNFNNTMIRTRYPHRTQLRTISMILTVAFDNKFDQIDEADCMFIFQIKHQYSFCVIAHILFNALLRVLT